MTRIVPTVIRGRVAELVRAKRIARLTGARLMQITGTRLTELARLDTGLSSFGHERPRLSIQPSDISHLSKLSSTQRFGTAFRHIHIPSLIAPRYQASRKSLGIYTDGKGNYLYPLENKERIIEIIGKANAVLHDWDVIEIKTVEGHDRIFLFPETESDKKAGSIVLDTSLFQAAEQKDETEIIFYVSQDGSDARSTSFVPAIAQMIRAIRERGYSIRVAYTEKEYRRLVTDMRPNIVLVSATEGNLGSAQKAYFYAKEVNPESILVFGGAAAIPELAEYYDIVVKGEGDIIICPLLKSLQAFASQRRPLSVNVTSWNKFKERDDLPSWTKAFIHDARKYSPVFTRDSADVLLELSATRYLFTADTVHSIDFPLGYYPEDGRSRIYIRTDQGIISPTPITLDERYQGAVTDWTQVHPGVPFPLNKKQFERAIYPDPINRELDTLYGRYPAMQDHRGQTESVLLHSQRGCRQKVERRCSFCSIQSPAKNRRMSIEHVIRLMKIAILHGKKYFIFTDDFFTMNKSRTRDLIKRIKSEKLYEKIGICIQTRSDALDDKMIAALSEICEEINLGIETLHAEQVERFGKVGQGMGVKYVEASKRVARSIARIGKAKPRFYMILMGLGASIRDIVEDIFHQVKLYVELLEITENPVAAFLYNTMQFPHYGDLITADMTGYPNAQPKNVPIREIMEGEMDRDILLLKLGNVLGIFHPYELIEEDGEVQAGGIFEPTDFMPLLTNSDFHHIDEKTLISLERRIPRQDYQLIEDVIIALFQAYQLGLFSQEFMDTCLGLLDKIAKEAVKLDTI